MNTASRLALYGAGLVAVFGVAFVVAKPLVPDSVVDRLTATEATHSDAGHGDHAAMPKSKAANLLGLATSTDGYSLSDLEAPATAGAPGQLTFRVVGSDGHPLTNYETAHGKQLHLMIVRTDGSGYHHVHPELNAATGVWSLPWTWSNAGTYRVFTDFTPTGKTESITLSRTVDVGGAFTPTPAVSTVNSVNVDGFTVNLTGELQAGASSMVTATITRDGQPVTTLQPYLGAFGHLVALRQGDLAYLHVHAMGDDPAANATSGPSIEFMASPPSAGRYFLYLDFQVDGVVRTAAFVLDAPIGSETR